jgi:plastocyanin domain-containing protein
MNKLLLVSLTVAAACSKAAAPAAPSTHVEIAITEKGFEPGDVMVPAGKPVTIVFERKTDQTCAKQIVVDTGDGTKVTKDLPLDQPVAIAATFAKPGKLGYACSMDMLKGTITVQ